MTTNSQELLEENDIKVVLVKNQTDDNAAAAISSKMIYIQIEN